MIALSPSLGSTKRRAAAAALAAAFALFAGTAAAAVPPDTAAATLAVDPPVAGTSHGTWSLEMKVAYCGGYDVGGWVALELSPAFPVARVPRASTAWFAGHRTSLVRTGRVFRITVPAGPWAQYCRAVPVALRVVLPPAAGLEAPRRPGIYPVRVATGAHPSPVTAWVRFVATSTCPSPAQPLPELCWVTPASGPPGSRLILWGRGLPPRPAVRVVAAAGTGPGESVAVTSSSGARLEVTLPRALPSGWYNLDLTAQGHTVSFPDVFLVTSPSRPRPILDRILPDRARPGATVTLTGRGFGARAGTVVLSPPREPSRWITAPILSWGRARVAVRVPRHAKAGTYDVFLRTAAGYGLNTFDTPVPWPATLAVGP